VQPLGSENMSPDQGMDWFKRGGTSPDLIGERREADLDVT
jgi:hypothetical protein